MRIGIVTFPESTSFGATLQMYALYSAVKRLHADAEVLNYQNEYMRKGLHTHASQQSTVKNLCRQALHIRQKLAFRRFEKEMKLYPRRTLHDPATLPEVSRRYDAMICGSDQVWNPDVTGADMSYFLDFCFPETRRIAYAPSFGLASLPKDFEDKVSQELAKFRYLSVREEDGRRLIEKMLHQNVSVVTDPTFLLRQEDWADVEQQHPLAQGEYILYYTVHSSRSLERFCKELAAKKHMKVIRIGGNFISQMKKRGSMAEDACDIGPREWLSLMRNAHCVVTNSFHGTAFALNFQKDFYVEFSSTANGRMENLIRMTGLQSRVVRDGKTDAAADEHIDYQAVNEGLDAARALSWEYLRRAVECE